LADPPETRHDPEPDPDKGTEPTAAAPASQPGAPRGAGVPPRRPPARREPADLSKVDLDLAAKHLARMVDGSGTLLRCDHQALRMMTGVVAVDIKGGQAAQGGVQLESVSARMGMSPNGLRNLFGIQWDMLGDLAVRMGIALSPQRQVQAEVMQSIPVEANRDHNGLGTDHLPQATASMRFFASSVMAPDRTSITRSRPYTVGTRHSAVSSRYDAAQVARFEAELRADGRASEEGVPLVPATRADHIEQMCRLRNELKGQLLQAAEQGWTSSPTVENVLRRCFPDELVVLELPEGPAPRRSTLYATVELLGDDADGLAVLERNGRRAVARCGDTTCRMAEEEFRRGTLEPVHPEVSALSAAMYVALAPWGDTWHWWADQELLVRRRMARARVETFTAFRLTNLSDDLAIAVALACLEQEDWPRECGRRAAKDGAWGRLSASSIRTHAGLRTALHLADAAMLAADRHLPPAQR
jgi:hypothetical protein